MTLFLDVDESKLHESSAATTNAESPSKSVVSVHELIDVDGQQWALALRHTTTTATCALTTTISNVS